MSSEDAGYYQCVVSDEAGVIIYSNVIYLQVVDNCEFNYHILYLIFTHFRPFWGTLQQIIRILKFYDEDALCNSPYPLLPPLFTDNSLSQI